MSSGLLPSPLNISGISARDGAQAFAGINLGSIYLADTEARQSQFIIIPESIFALILTAEWDH
jgi:hypothetical protein